MNPVEALRLDDDYNSILNLYLDLSATALKELLVYQEYILLIRPSPKGRPLQDRLCISCSKIGRCRIILCRMGRLYSEILGP